MITSKIYKASKLEMGDKITIDSETRNVISINQNIYSYVTSDYIIRYDSKGTTKAPRFTGTLKDLQELIDQGETVIERDPDPTGMLCHQVEGIPLINKEGWWANPIIEFEINNHIKIMTIQPDYPSLMIDVADQQISQRGVFFD